MKYVILTGGIGNQMFQYAFALAMRHRGYKLKLDISIYDHYKMHNGYELERVFQINEDILNRPHLHRLWLALLERYNLADIVCKDNYRFNPNVFSKKYRYYWGYWQNEKYFRGIEPLILSQFTFHNIGHANQNLAFAMQKTNSVSIHIRRGDYLKAGMTLIVEDYYKKAVDFINNHVESPQYYVFSDDGIEAEKIVSHLSITYKIVQHNKGIDSYKDMYLMSQCHHNIIANSSFSWWSAWLNGNENKIVIAPAIWDASIPAFHPQQKDWILL